MQKFQLRGLILAGLVAFTILSSTVALAHETRPVVGGKYTVRVGFINEPTYQGLPNGLELTVCTGTCTTSKDGLGTLTNGVEGAFDTLKAEVIVGSQSMSLTLVPVARQPGRYNAPFVPTRVGDYTFHIYGKINDDPIDERFTSGPDTFDPVQPLTNAQFPDKPGYGSSSASGPVTTAAATPVTAATTAVSATTPPATVASTPQTAPATPAVSAAQMQALQTQLSTQKQQLDDAKASASTASTFAYIGIGLGLIGLIVAGIALFTRRTPNEPERG